MSTNTVCRIALKEWAVAVKALDRGEQIMLLRKGGIREEGKDFRVIHPEFLLYPTFEHQKDELLQEKYHQDLRQVLSEAQGGDTITFSHWAGVEEVIELTEQDKLDTLSPYHIWSDDYAQKRLHWKPKVSPVRHASADTPAGGATDCSLSAKLRRLQVLGRVVRGCGPGPSHPRACGGGFSQ